jgi:sulfide dehydrogenase [flavocytochrome c] flavoprotein subunit
VVNVIPPQRAANVMVKSALVGEDKRWCPVDTVSFESTLAKGVHILGDATSIPSDGPAMPKSGYSANSQAKFCAINVVNMMNGKPTVQFSGINVCYSGLSDSTAVSPVDFSLTKVEFIYGESWLRNILAEMST